MGCAPSLAQRAPQAIGSVRVTSGGAGRTACVVHARWPDVSWHVLARRYTWCRCDSLVTCRTFRRLPLLWQCAHTGDEVLRVAKTREWHADVLLVVHGDFPAGVRLD